MPIYEYQCPYCHHELEALQKMSEAPLSLCPECKKEGLVRLVSAAGFQLKGTGWYKTDYSSKGKSTEAKEGDKEGKVTSGEDKTKDKTSTDSASEQKKEVKTEKNKSNDTSQSSTKSET